MSGLHGNSARGFTLIELLVSMAIFVTIMSGVAVMFNSAVRVTKQAYLNQIAFETMRGTFDTIERDLTRAFVSRETGHKHTFYGTPIGFTFIGLVDADGTDEFNLARITYVMYADPDGQGLTRRYKSTADDENAAEECTTYSLLRYIEPGVEDLESFPINWNFNFNPDSDEIDPISKARNLAFDEGLCLSDDPRDPCQEEIEKAKRRELWIRMLAGGDNNSEAVIPNFWRTPEVRSGGLQDDVLDPADYVIAENILHIERIIPFDPEDNTTYEFVTSDPFNSGSNLFIDPQGDDMALIPTTLNGSDATDAAKIEAYIFENFDRNVVAHQNYFFAYREYAERDRLETQIINGVEEEVDVFKVDATGLLTEIQEREFVGRLFAFWNDRRNLEHNTMLSAFNLDPVNNTGGFPATDLVSTQPDIMDPTLPESIMIQLAFFYPSPYPGAPDFEKIFTLSINLPTAYKRKLESVETKRLRGD